MSLNVPLAASLTIYSPIYGLLVPVANQVSLHRLQEWAGLSQ